MEIPIIHSLQSSETYLEFALSSASTREEDLCRWSAATDRNTL